MQRSLRKTCAVEKCAANAEMEVAAANAEKRCGS
jgi:hypothetical protein